MVRLLFFYLEPKGGDCGRGNSDGGECRPAVQQDGDSMVSLQ